MSSAALERSERKRVGTDAIDAMPEIDRTVMVLSYCEGLTRREVAAMMGIMGIEALQVTKLKWNSILRLRVKMGKQLRCRARRPGSDLTNSRQHSTMLLRIA